MKLVRRIIGKCCHIFHTNVAKFFPERGRVLMLHWVGDEVQDEETEPFVSLRSNAGSSFSG